MPTTLQVGVKIFLRNPEGKYLLVQRSSEKYKNARGHWDIVGGRIDPGSPLVENLRREVHEETGLDITSEPILIHAQDIMLPERDLHVIRLTYVGNTSGEPVLDTMENISYTWISPSEIRDHDDLDIFVNDVIEKGLLPI
ncbi:MAG: NUDIX domain-containing protein [Candidatus Yonathbacteria bacterium]|nr:NUDIX domain-containing protein [Candidatus Yonathbacteria bacterium]